MPVIACHCLGRRPEAHPEAQECDAISSPWAIGAKGLQLRRRARNEGLEGAAVMQQARDTRVGRGRVAAPAFAHQPKANAAGDRVRARARELARPSRLARSGATASAGGGPACGARGVSQRRRRHAGRLLRRGALSARLLRLVWRRQLSTDTKKAEALCTFCRDINTHKHTNRALGNIIVLRSTLLRC
jgi:hypothetical protein